MLSKYKVPANFIDKIIKPACGGDSAIIEAFTKVPREFFMDEAMRLRAYLDDAQPIGYKQTISQPSLVATMLKELEITNKHKCLEIGSGSGFVTALLARLCDEVVAVDILPELVSRAQEKIRQLRLYNVRLFTSDGSLGLKERAPYDRILVSAGAKSMPSPLLDQLADGGIMIIPVGGILTKVVKSEGKITETSLAKVAFVDFINT